MQCTQSVKLTVHSRRCPGHGVQVTPVSRSRCPGHGVQVTPVHSSPGHSSVKAVSSVKCTQVQATVSRSRCPGHSSALKSRSLQCQGGVQCQVHSSPGHGVQVTVSRSLQCTQVQVTPVSRRCPVSSALKSRPRCPGHGVQVTPVHSSPGHSSVKASSALKSRPRCPGHGVQCALKSRSLQCQGGVQCQVHSSATVSRSVHCTQVQVTPVHSSECQCSALYPVHSSALKVSS